MGKSYQFDIDLACQYGVHEAIFLHYLIFWCRKNKANGRHHHDGRYWSYNSIEAFRELFPFWTTKMIRGIIQRLLEKDVILTGNFNKNTFDRTLWYTVKDQGLLELPQRANAEAQEGESNGSEGQMDLADLADGSAQEGEPIPYNKPYELPDPIPYDHMSGKVYREKMWKRLMNAYGLEEDRIREEGTNFRMHWKLILGEKDIGQEKVLGVLVGFYDRWAGSVKANGLYKQFQNMKHFSHATIRRMQAIRDGGYEPDDLLAFYLGGIFSKKGYLLKPTEIEESDPPLKQLIMRWPIKEGE